MPSSDALLNLLEDLQAMDSADVQSATLDELEEVCRNPVFRLLCDVCDALKRKEPKKC